MEGGARERERERALAFGGRRREGARRHRRRRREPPFLLTAARARPDIWSLCNASRFVSPSCPVRSFRASVAFRIVILAARSRSSSSRQSRYQNPTAPSRHLAPPSPPASADGRRRSASPSAAPQDRPASMAARSSPLSSLRARWIVRSLDHTSNAPQRTASTRSARIFSTIAPPPPLASPLLRQQRKRAALVPRFDEASNRHEPIGASSGRPPSALGCRAGSPSGRWAARAREHAEDGPRSSS